MVRRDTIKAPLARAESPALTDIGTTFRWDRTALFASGALTVADLLDRMPGVTTFRARWVAAPMVASYLGDPGRVRVFYDGIELDPMDGRDNGVVDLTDVQLWSLDEVAVERGASELRVYLRSWRTDRTTPYTRTDVASGDEETNYYRGFFGKRFGGGTALQVAGQQNSTSNPRGGGDGDALSLLSRVGYASGPWKADAFIIRTRRTRNELQPSNFPLLTDGLNFPPVPALEATQTLAYVRAGYGDPEGGPWAQVVASSFGFKESSPKVDAARAASTGLAVDQADTATSRAEYVASAGYTRGALRVSATNRLRIPGGGGERFVSPSARVAFDRPRLAVSLFAERNAVDDRLRTEALVRLAPLPFLALSGAVSQTSDGEVRIASFTGGDSLAHIPTSRAARAEVGVRLGRLWASGGVLARDSTLLRAPTTFDRRYATVLDGSATGTFASLRGPVYKDLYLDVVGTRWDGGDSFYRPQFQTRSQLYLRTNWLRKFPTGNFGLLAGVTHDYRSYAFVPVADEAGLLRATQSRTFSTLIELRIVDAVLSWQFRNIVGERYTTVPGFEMPRAISVYGVRWEFWN